MRLRFRLLAAAFLLVLPLASYVLAGLPIFWSLEGQEDFLAGEVDGLSISSDGVISLAPATQNLYEGTDPFFWSLVSDEQGNLFAGSGNEGKVYKIDPQGNATVLLDTNELEVHALAVDREGNLYAGTSPRGRVYKITPAGDQNVFFDPDDRYIWALAFDQAGNLLVATGDEGNLYRVTPSGNSEVLFASQETHLICLATGSDGNIYAGSDSSGLVFKIDSTDRASVLFDTPFREVRALLVDTRGNVFAATVNENSGAAAPAPASPPPSTPAPTGATPTPPVATQGVVETVTVSASAISVPDAPAAGGGLRGAVYRIRPEGAAERLWSSRADIPLSMKLERDDRLMVGTGRQGRIFLVRQDKTSSLLLRAAADQVTSIHSEDGRTVYFATSNPAKIYRFDTGRRSEGEYRSPIRDTTTVSSWGKIRWDGRTQAGTDLVIQTRSGNSAKPDNTWSDWSAGYTVPEGEQITSPKGRFLQWRTILKTSDAATTPELLKLTAIYLQQNLSPEVTAITLHPPGRVFQKPLVATGEVEILGLTTPLETEGPLPDGNVSGAANAFNRPNLTPTAYSRNFYKKGLQTVEWSATDPNEDMLTYDVFYRAEGETLWKPIRQNLREAVIAWDTVTMPDGRYTLKVVASDSPSNPQTLALSGERESQPFDVDNTPPRVVDLDVSRSEGDSHRLRFVAIDDSSAVRKVEYSVDSGQWVIVYPEDGICDSKRETFDITVSGYSEGVHTLVLKVTDLLENVATARAELR